MNKDKKIRSLKWKFAKIMLLCWVLPFLVIIGLVGSYMLITQRENQMERLAAQAGLNTRTCAERLNGAIADSRQATYDGTLFEQYRQYRRQGSSGERIFSNGVQNYLNAQYSHKKNNIFTVLMLKEDPLNKHYTSYNFGTGGSYGMIQHFFSQDRDQVLELAKSLDTAVGFLKTDNGFYIVRNMMDRSFTAWGILVSRVNVNYCFEPVKTAWEDFHVQLNISGNPFVEAGKVVSIEDIRAEYPEYASNMKDDMIPASPADGVQYAVPFYGYWEGLYVNKAVMEAAGAEIPTADTTWDQFLETCQVIKNAGYTPIATSLAKEPHYWFEFAIYNHDSAKTHTTVPEAVDDAAGEAWQAGLADIKDLYEKGFLSENTNTATGDEVFQSFLEGKSAFYLDGSWKMGGIKEGTDDIDNFTVTYVPGNVDRKSTDIIGGLSSGWYISTKCWEDEAKRDAAVSLVEKFISDETVSAFAGTATTALKNGAEIDESSLTNLEKDALAMPKDTTGITGAVQDLVTQDERAPIFDNMPQIVEGQTEITDALQEMLDIIEENAE